MDEATTTEVTTPPVKVLRKPRTPKAEVVATPTPKAAKPPKAILAKPAPKAVKPAIPMYDFATGSHVSAGLNSAISRRPVDFTRFGQFVDAPMTQRDEDSMAAFRKSFGERAFPRQNIDAGILRRLGERGVIIHVSGDETSATAMFRLSAKGLGKAPARAKKAA